MEGQLNMEINIHEYLVDLEGRIDEVQEEKLLADYYAFADRKMDDRSYFEPKRNPAPSNLDWPDICFNDTFREFDKMIYKQLRRCNDQLTKGGGELLVVRPSYGIGLIPSMFGCELKFLPDEQDYLPSPVKMDWDSIMQLVEDFKSGKKPDVRSGLGQKCIDAGHHLEELLENYPKLKKYLHLYTPDTQGPCDVAEALIGSDFYLDLYDEEDAIHDITDMITDTFIRFVRVWKEEFPCCGNDYSFDYGLIYKGGILIREDSACNISGTMYDEFFFESDQKIISAFNGGLIHFCGRGDHLVKSFSNIEGVTAINMSQPDMNKMDEIVYPNTIDKDIQIIGMPKFEIRRCDRHGINLKGMVHVGICVAAWMGEPETDPRGEDC